MHRCLTFKGLVRNIEMDKNTSACFELEKFTKTK